MSSFKTRLTLRLAALVTATTIGVLLAGGWLLNQQMMQRVEQMHDVEGEELRELIGPRPTLTTDDLSGLIKHDADSDAALFFIQVYDERGAVLFRSANLGSTILPNLPDAEPHWTTRLPAIGDVRISEYREAAWHIQVASALSPTRRILTEYVRVSGLLIVATGLASLALGYAFSRYTLAPVRAIEATARRIGGDNLVERIPMPPGRDELTALTALLNQMFDRLQGSFEQVKRFTADASHELKTPLALIRLNAEKIRPRLAQDPESEAALGDLMEEATRLQQIIDSLLFLSKTDSGALPVERKPFDPQALVAVLAEDADALAADRQMQFVLGRNETATLHGEPILIRQLLLNVVVNALNASKPGGRVLLDSYREGEAWHLVVRDEGPGLPPAQLERIFERFVRYDGSSSDGTRGHGLGLAICRSIAQLHGGTITAQNRADRPGLEVKTVLPI